MSCRSIAAGVALLAACALVSAAAAGPVMPSSHGGHGRGRGIGSGGLRHSPGPIGGHSSRHGIGGLHHYPSHGYHSRAYRMYPHWPSYGYGFGGYYPYPVYPPYPYPPYYDPLFVPPVYLPAETLYGPEAVKRFMGVDHWFGPKPNVNVIVVPNQGAAGAAAQGVPPADPAGQAPPNPPPGNAAPPAQPKPRPVNPQTIALAWKFIGYGDAHFGNQRYVDANARYRKATGVAPQLADAWFRQSFALSAMGRYELAARAIKRGLQFEANWAHSDFQVKELYGGNELAKAAHLDALAQAAEENPNDADLLFLLGVQLHFDGRRERAAPFFQRAKQLLAGEDGHLQGFLP